MNSRNRKTVYWFVIAFIVSLLLVMGSYFIGSSKQKEKLTEQANQYSSMYAANVSSSTANDLISLNPDNLAAEFARNRKQTTAAAYLSFIASEDKKPVVTSLVTVEALASSNKDSVLKLAEQGLAGVQYQQMDFFGQTMNKLVKSDIAAQVAKSKPHLLLINLPTENDYAAGTKIKNFTADLDVLYTNIRKASPETLIVFMLMPEDRKEIFEDDKYGEFVKATTAHLADKNYNLFNLKQNFAKKVTLDAMFGKNGRLTKASLQTLTSEVNDVLINTKLNAVDGFMGKNADVKAASAEESSKPQIAEESDPKVPEPERSIITETVEGEIRVEYVQNPDVLSGKESVIQYGTPAVSEVTYEIITLEGAVQSRTEIDSIIIAEGTPTVIEMGTGTYTELPFTPGNTNSRADEASQSKESSNTDAASESSDQEKNDKPTNDETSKDETSKVESD